AVYMALWQGTILAESRRHAKELQGQRLLAEQAEASRFTELRAAFQEEMTRLTERLTVAHEALRTEIRDNANSLAAALGEMDDRLRRAP
nr:LapA family protein [Pseudomonadota bacterium]